MSQNKQRLSWLEMLKVNQRAYLLFYKRYPRMILSRFALIIWKALTPYVGIYFSALIIEELAGAKNPGRIRFLVLLTLFLIAAGSLVTALLEKWKNVQSAGMWLKIKKILSEKLFETDYVNLNETKNMELYSAICQNHNSAGWGLYRTLEDCEALCQTVIVILGGASLTLSLFTSQVPESAGKYTILNNPLFVILIALIMLAVTCISPVLAGKAGRYLTSLADIHNLGNRMFSYYGHLGYDTKKAADMRIYRQDKICEKYNLNKESTFGSRGVFARYQKGPVGFYLAGASAVSGIFTGIAYVFVCLKAWAGDTACRSVIARRMIARCDRCLRHENTILVAPHFLLRNAHLDVCISDIIGRAVIGRIEVNRVEISLCFVLDRLQKCLRRLLLVDAPAVIAARIQVNGRAKTRFEGMRQPEGVRLIRHMAHKSCRFVLRNRVGSILPLYEPAL